MGTVNCLVVCAMPVFPAVLGRLGGFSPDLTIAADGGYLRCAELGLTPDLILGDFDSAPEPVDGSAVVYPAHKDDTDCMLAVKEGFSRGCRDFLLIGCTGGRLDHTLAAIHTLNWLVEHGAHGTIVDEQHFLTVLDSGGQLKLPYGCEYLSVFSLGDCCTGVTLGGVAYPLDDYTLTNTFPLGVSNKITEEHCHISLKTGRLLVMTVG